MPSITARICGICPVSHLLASSKACDAIMAVRIPETAVKLRELLHCGQFVQSHALSFFHLSAPDLLLGMDSDPAKRNVAGPAREAPRRPPRRDRAAQVRPAGDRAAGQGARPPLVDGAGRRQRAARPARARDAPRPSCPAAKAIVARTLDLWKDVARRLPGRDRVLRQLPHACTAASSDRTARCACTTATCASSARTATMVADQVQPDDYATLHRRGDARRLLPQGALLQAARLPRRHLPRRPAGPPQRRRPLRHARGGRGARPSTASVRPHRPERLPLPLRAADRGHLRPRAHGEAAQRPRHPRHQGARHRRRERARRRRHHRGAARHADPPLQGGRRTAP